MMLSDSYFANLGQPAADRLERLPIWARVYIHSLRAEAIWWHLAACGRPRAKRRIVPEPTIERLQRLPVFAFDWIYTLRFEVFWWRTQTFRRMQPVQQTTPSAEGVLA